MQDSHYSYTNQVINWVTRKTGMFCLDQKRCAGSLKNRVLWVLEGSKVAAARIQMVADPNGKSYAIAKAQRCLRPWRGRSKPAAESK